MNSDGPGSPRRRADDDLPEPQIFRSRTFRVVAWAVLFVLGASVLLLLAMALWPAG